MSYTILLVEDNPHIMEINAEALMMEDYTVLLARVEARLRSAQRKKRFLNYAGLRLDTALLSAYSGDTDLLLSQKEFLLLLTLIRNPNRPMEKEELFRAVWGSEAVGDLSALHTAISRLKKSWKPSENGCPTAEARDTRWRKYSRVSKREPAFPIPFAFTNRISFFV